MVFAAPNVELTGPTRQDGQAARRMINRGAAWPGWPAVAAPVERHVRPHVFAARRVIPVWTRLATFRRLNAGYT